MIIIDTKYDYKNISINNTVSSEIQAQQKELDIAFNQSSKQFSGKDFTSGTSRISIPTS